MPPHSQIVSSRLNSRKSSQNVMEVLRKNLPKVLAQTHNMIVSVIQIPNNLVGKNCRRTNKLSRVCYYLTNPTRRYGTHITIKAEIFNIHKNPEQDEINKYEIIGDFITDPRCLDNDVVYFNNFDETTQLIGQCLEYFDEIRGQIDTVTLINKFNESDIKLVYDRTGYGHVGQELKGKINHWQRIRHGATLTGHPSTLKQMGYFNEQPGDDKNLIEKMRKMDLGYEPPPPGGPFSFGKRVKTMSKLKRDLKLLKV